MYLEKSKEELVLKQASYAALASLLNLTMLPIAGFVALMFLYNKTEPETIGRYHAVLGMKINISAAITLFLVCGLMIFLGGFNSPWTWVYVISYFTIVHAGFIMLTVWALVRSWSGDKLRAKTR
jgi:MFS family permease